MTLPHALIIAAGDGGRLQPLTNGTPKPLLRVHGRPMINHVLDSLFAGGIREATMVVGFEGEQLRCALSNLRPCGMSISFVENDAWHLHNARSIWAARDAMAPHAGFLLAMADHLVDPGIIRATVAGANGRPRLAVDHAAPDDPRADEATRALVDDARVTDLGKALARWNALDTGIFWCTPRIFDALTPELRDGEAGAVFAAFARAGDLDAVDVTGMSWIDVDTADDLRAAGAMLDAIRGSGRR